MDFAIKFFQDSGVAIYFSIAIMAVGMTFVVIAGQIPDPSRAIAYRPSRVLGLAGLDAERKKHRSA